MVTGARGGDVVSGAPSTVERIRAVARTGITVAVIVGAVLTVCPLGFHGLGLVQLVLLVVNSAVLLMRSLPERFVPEPAGTIGVWVGVFASAALMACDSSSVAVVFPYFVAGQAGYRLPVRRAVVVAVSVSVCSAAALAVAADVGHPAIPWSVGLFAGAPVVLGILRRDRVETLRSTRIALEQTRRAAESEARERALAERTRIARDIHDVLAHSLTGVSMQLQLADALMDRDRIEEGRQAVRKAAGMVREGLSEARRAVTALREDSLPLEQTIVAMLETDLADERFELSGSPRPVDTAVSQALVRSVQEALTNARKHAPGAPIRLRLVFDDAAVGVEVVNGPGAADVELSASGSGMGLVGMRERAALLGGTVEAGPVTDGDYIGGWRVEVRIPG
ncbi:sensor histidine kinase [Prescottella agglutinans]|uniref:histidine kinase n=1 Tax=Prescottella agglutinans TaxID=1644129 RepID=A0ABT6MHL4_9NOCA|nr:sensor histidine kinase [Prescottella agglutinans]MDH6283811.1 signal transduction histidine kinase [Prescottella agglutinans]